MKISPNSTAGYVAVAAMVPYLSIKAAWLLGSDIGVVEPGLMRTTPFVVGNLITAAMELAGAALALALVHGWGQRLPAWLVLFPLWVAGGLLAPVMLAAPFGFLAGNAATPAADNPIDGLQGWVYGVVYVGFIVQGTGLAVAFVLQVRSRWAHLFRARLDGIGSPGSIQARTAAAFGVLAGVVVTVRLFWALGGSTGLASEVRAGRAVAQRALDSSTAGLALAGLVGLLILLSRRPEGTRVWGPLAAAWLGTGAMFCSGGYQLTLLLAPSTPFDASGGGWFGLTIGTQVLAGLLGATILYGVRLSPSPVPAPTATGPTCSAQVARLGAGRTRLCAVSADSQEKASTIEVEPSLSAVPERVLADESSAIRSCPRCPGPDRAHRGQHGGRRAHRTRPSPRRPGRLDAAALLARRGSHSLTTARS